MQAGHNPAGGLFEDENQDVDLNLE